MKVSGLHQFLSLALMTVMSGWVDANSRATDHYQLTTRNGASTIPELHGLLASRGFNDRPQNCDSRVSCMTGVEKLGTAIGIIVGVCIIVALSVWWCCPGCCGACGGKKRQPRRSRRCFPQARAEKGAGIGGDGEGPALATSAHMMPPNVAVPPHFHEMGGRDLGDRPGAVGVHEMDQPPPSYEQASSKV